MFLFLGKLQNEIKNNLVASIKVIMVVKTTTETLNKELHYNSQALRIELTIIL